MFPNLWDAVLFETRYQRYVREVTAYGFYRDKSRKAFAHFADKPPFAPISSTYDEYGRKIDKIV